MNDWLSRNEYTEAETDGRHFTNYILDMNCCSLTQNLFKFISQGLISIFLNSSQLWFRWWLGTDNHICIMRNRLFLKICLKQYKAIISLNFMTGQFESHLNQVCKGQHYHNGGNHSQMNIYIMVKVKYLGVAKEGHFRGMWQLLILKPPPMVFWPQHLCSLWRRVHCDRLLKLLKMILCEMLYPKV